jgi:hypothetical protein
MHDCVDRPQPKLLQIVHVLTPPDSSFFSGESCDWPLMRSKLQIYVLPYLLTALLSFERFGLYF